MLPESPKDDLIAHISEVRSLYDQDRKKDINAIYLPGALEKKYPNAGKEWGWFWLFPSKSLSVDPRTHTVRRHHLLLHNFRRHLRVLLQRQVLQNRHQFIRCGITLPRIFWRTDMTSG
jgi:hypothetical protein